LNKKNKDTCYSNDISEINKYRNKVSTDLKGNQNLQKRQNSQSCIYIPPSNNRIKSRLVQRRNSFNLMEEFLFFESHKILGHRWSLIKKYFPYV